MPLDKMLLTLSIKKIRNRVQKENNKMNILKKRGLYIVGIVLIILLFLCIIILLKRRNDTNKPETVADSTQITTMIKETTTSTIKSTECTTNNDVTIAETTVSIDNENTTVSTKAIELETTVSKESNVSETEPIKNDTDNKPGSSEIQTGYTSWGDGIIRNSFVVELDEKHGGPTALPENKQELKIYRKEHDSHVLEGDGYWYGENVNTKCVFNDGLYYDASSVSDVKEKYGEPINAYNDGGRYIIVYQYKGENIKQDERVYIQYLFYNDSRILEFIGICEFSDDCKPS